MASLIHHSLKLRDGSCMAVMNGCPISFSTSSCTHNNGFYSSIPFWIFKKRIFSCTDCGESFWGKKLKLVERLERV